jgi:hypothetical protein
MGPETVMLIKLLSDIIISATATLRRVHQMTEEETKAAIKEAEATTQSLLDKLGPPPSSGDTTT